MFGALPDGIRVAPVGADGTPAPVIAIPGGGCRVIRYGQPLGMLDMKKLVRTLVPASAAAAACLATRTARNVASFHPPLAGAPR